MRRRSAISNKPMAAAITTAASALLGPPELRLTACSRWPEKAGCGQPCLSQIAASPQEPSDARPKPPANPLGKKERGGHQRTPKIEVGEISRAAAPVVEQHQSPRVLDEPLERNDEQVHVVDLSEERNEIRDQIDRRDDVHDRAQHE